MGEKVPVESEDTCISQINTNTFVILEIFKSRRVTQYITHWKTLNGSDPEMNYTGLNLECLQQSQRLIKKNF